MQSSFVERFYSRKRDENWWQFQIHQFQITRVNFINIMWIISTRICSTIRTCSIIVKSFNISFILLKRKRDNEWNKYKMNKEFNRKKNKWKFKILSCKNESRVSLNTHIVYVLKNKFCEKSFAIKKQKKNI